MRPRWLLLAVSLLCLLLLFPAAALSQGGTEIACGSAVVDGTIGAAEWADATKLPMAGYYSYVLGGATTEGSLYLKNDEQFLYVGATLDIGEEDPSWWETALEVAFTDEPCGDPPAWVDDKWAAADCDASPGEGTFLAQEGQSGSTHGKKGPDFVPGAEAYYWCMTDMVAAQGVKAVAGLHTAHYEMQIDLTNSELNCVGPGDCFRMYVLLWEEFCAAPDCEDYEIGGWVSWPGFLDEGSFLPDFGTICLNPCGVEEEFVPEPATILLLASGLVGLAGYAGLRRRATE